MLQIKVCSPGELLLNIDQHTVIKGICSLSWGVPFRSPTSLPIICLFDLSLKGAICPFLPSVTIIFFPNDFSEI